MTLTAQNSTLTSSPTTDAAGREVLWGYPPIVIAALAHLLIWSIGPQLIFGNLHSDTLEAAYWGRDLALGYAKHPPLATWLIDAVLRIGLPPIFALMLLSQTGMAIAAFFVWRTVRLYASSMTATLAVVLFLVAPSATIYAVQLNHNSLLAPFWAASMYFGLSYLEERRLRDAIGLGIAAALGMLTKYEIAFLLVSLVVLAISVKRFRPAFSTPASYVCVCIFLAMIAPHVAWLDANSWPSASRAMGADKMRNVATLNQSAVNAIVGMFTLFVAPIAVLIGTVNRRVGRVARGPDTKLIGQVLAFGPPLVLLAGAIVTLQILKPLWVLALSSSVAAGLALLFPAGDTQSGLSERTSASILAPVSAAILALFSLYLVIAGSLGKPLTAYSADTQKLSTAIEQLWASHQKTPLACVVISDRKIGPSGVLFFKNRPDFVDFSSPSWATPRQIGECRQSGAIAALADPTNALSYFPSACRAETKTFQVPAKHQLKATWPVELVYIAPEGAAGGGCDAPAAR
jgi:hypothetical protein